jgi:uncharacterized phage protein (TIGR01671 family)
MRREIKFRLYSHRLKVMYTPENQIGGLWSIPESPNGILTTPDNDVLMQFTGLKDKNGIDVYESDIVQFDDIFAIIEFFDGKFQMITSTNHWLSPVAKERLIRFEVVGNIYQNPELI